MAEDIRSQMLAMSEALDPIREFVIGYKAKLEADGFHSVSADRMAEQLHAELMKKAFGGSTAAQGGES